MLYSGGEWSTQESITGDEFILSDQTCRYNRTEEVPQRETVCGGLKKKRKEEDDDCTGAAVFHQHSYSTVSPSSAVTPQEIIRQLQTTPPPLLLGLVRLVCREEGHAVGPEVGVEVRGLVESPAAHLAAQVSVSVLALCLRRTGGWRAVWRAVGAGGAAVRVALGVPHSVSDETVPAERAGRCKADPALQALEGGGVAPMLGDVALKLGPVFCSEPAGDAAKNVIFLLCLTGCH